MLTRIVESIFQPGINESVKMFTIFVFIALISVLIVMIFATNFNIHVIIMFLLATGLLAALSWFMTVQEKYKRMEEEDDTKDSKEYTKLD